MDNKMSFEEFYAIEKQKIEAFRVYAHKMFAEWIENDIQVDWFEKYMTFLEEVIGEEHYA